MTSQKRIRKALFSVVATALFAGAIFGQAGHQPSPMPSVIFAKYYRTELFMGRSKPDGTLVSEPELKTFLAETVTPRFPDGFTVINAFGQFRDRSGKMIAEPSVVLIFLYPDGSKKISRTKIEEIRAAYSIRFQQESVLRVDLPKAARVSF